MKQNIAFYLCIIIVSVTMFACQKDTGHVSGRTDNLPAINPENIDLEAGIWKPVLLTRPDTFTVVAPAATNSASYLADINEIKSAQSHFTNTQKENITYWSAGAVLRWNEILLNLIAKYNLPPYQSNDASYPIPSAVNPFAYPLFPFSNPPYAARALAYVSAAQYDALVAAWHYKKLYNRAAPYAADSSITAMLPRTALPSYPSEDAVLAGVTAEMLKLLFPTEIDYIQQQLYAEEESRINAGANVRSDITAGESLGRQVAQLFTARAKTDNAGKAVGTSNDWANYVTITKARGETPWYSLETPQRPPMLPLFGNVKPFLFDSSTVVQLRPGPPPSTSSDDMKRATADTYAEIKNPTRDQIALVQFWADGVGTYTPPGHWNAIADEDFIKQNYSEVRWARNMALLNMSLMDAGIVCWNTKYFYYNPRPTQIDPNIKTLTGIPNFPSYISGHSSFSEAAATILGHIMPVNASKYEAMSNDAAMSRFKSGIHTMLDCTAGLETGKKVGGYAVQRALNDGAE